MACLHEDAQRFAGCVGDQGRVRVSVRHLSEAGEVADDSPELVRAHPRSREGAVAAAAATGDAPLGGVLGDRVAPCDLGDDLSQEKGDVAVVERVVLGVAVLRLFGVLEDAGVYEDADSDRYLAAVDEVVQHDGAADLPVRVQVPPPVLEHHQRRGFGGVVLRGHMNPVPPRGAGVDRALAPVELHGRACGDARLYIRIGPVGVANVLLVDGERTKGQLDGHVRTLEMLCDRLKGIVCGLFGATAVIKR